MIKRYLKFVKPYRYRIIATIIVGIIIRYSHAHTFID